MCVCIYLVCAYGPGQRGNWQGGWMTGQRGQTVDCIDCYRPGLTQNNTMYGIAQDTDRITVAANSWLGSLAPVDLRQVIITVLPLWYIFTVGIDVCLLVLVLSSFSASVPTLGY